MVAVPSVRVGSPVAHDRLTVFPLFLEAPSAPGYRLSEEALADGTAVVEEVSEGGSVPNLAVDNRGNALVLFVEGQELRGAKQNRVLNSSVLIGAHTKTVIPVSCVEQGRWRYVSKQFSSSGYHGSAKLRAVLKKSVNDSTLSGRGH
ncbi:MAG: ARPP-1 family domain-containing protein, partial [Gemmata sp.]